jgi:hypothetical protein
VVRKGYFYSNKGIAMLTPNDIFLLKNTKSEAEWNVLRDRIKSNNGGKFPANWNEKVVVSGLLAQASRRWKTQESDLTRNVKWALKLLAGITLTFIVGLALWGYISKSEQELRCVRLLNGTLICTQN